MQRKLQKNWRQPAVIEEKKSCFKLQQIQRMNSSSQLSSLNYLSLSGSPSIVHCFLGWQLAFSVNNICERIQNLEHWKWISFRWNCMGLTCWLIETFQRRSFLVKLLDCWEHFQTGSAEGSANKASHARHSQLFSLRAPAIVEALHGDFTDFEVNAQLLEAYESAWICSGWDIIPITIGAVASDPMD